MMNEPKDKKALKSNTLPFAGGLVKELVIIAIIIGDAYSEQIFAQIDGGEYDVINIIYDAAVHVYKKIEGKFNLPPEKRPCYDEFVMVNSARYIIKKYDISLKIK